MQLKKFQILKKMSSEDKKLENFIESLQRIEGEMQLLSEEKKDLL